MLFNIYLSDLNFSLDDNNSITLFSKRISHLLYADDLVIISPSPTGLQHSLNSLHDYCTKWKLDININKTKVVIFSKAKIQNASCFTFNIGDKPIEITNEYKYLGIIFSSNGSFHQAKSILEKKAKRALFCMHSYLSDQSLPPHYSLDLYEKLIQPVASYALEIWAPFCVSINGLLKGNCHIFDEYLDFPGAKCHMRFCKRILGVHDKAVNLAVAR